MNTRRCHVCKVNKPLTTEYFALRRQDKLGFRRACKECENAYRRKIYPEQYKRITIPYNKKRYANPRQRAIQLLASYKYMDFKKGHEFNLTSEQVESIFEMPCTYCGEYNILKMGLDRKDNSKGHTVDNVQPCCAECNTAKSDHFTDKEMHIIGSIIRVIKDARKDSKMGEVNILDFCAL